MMQLLPFVGLLAVISAAALALGYRVSWRLVALHALLMLGTLAAATDTLGTPKPLWAELRERDEIEVIAAHYHPGVAIYVWSRADPPRVYQLPWNVNTARAMQEAIRETGGAVLRLGESEDGGWVPYPLPQPPNKPKETDE